MIMYNAYLSNGASFRTLPSRAFDFGVDDFTVGAMIATSTGGPVISRLGPAGRGFVLTINPDSTITFRITDGTATWQSQTGGTDVLDGCCHSLLAVRIGERVQILLDGRSLAWTGTGATPKLNVNSSLPLMIGWTSASQPVTQFTGTVMNAGAWSTALTGGQVVAAAFARVRATDPGLQGYWTLDQTTDDRSPNANPATIVGPVRFLPCVDCIFTAGASGYGFCQMANAPTAEQREDPGLLAAGPISQTRHIQVQPGTPALFASIMSDADTPAFPAGAVVTVTDPSGRTYNSDVNSDKILVVTRGGQPWGMSVVSPQPGSWHLTVTAPPATGFLLQLQTCPAAAVVPSITDALLPLYGPDTAAAGLTAEAGGWLSVLTKVAVAALTGVAVAGIVVLSGGTALPAVAAGIVAFASVSLLEAQLSLPELNTTSMPAATIQVGGMAGFLVAVDGLLLADANADLATQLQYKRRARVLYPYVTASTFSKKQQSLVGARDTRKNISAGLKSFGPGYASLAGHGRPSYLTGWYVSGNSGPLQEILTVGNYSPDEARSKIIHIFGCHCGSTSAIGLGRDLVAKGAVAFFGYSAEFIFPASEYPTFCDCDIEIDKEMIDGKNCDEAYQAAIAKYNAGISRYRANGDYQSAAYLETDRNRLVAPSTDAAYGSKTAFLKTGAHP